MSQNSVCDPQSFLPVCDREEHQAVRRLSLPAPPETLERAAHLFRAVGDVSRLRLLDYLMDGERCVSEIAQAMDAGMSTVSQQLRLLREEELVISRRVGKHIYYSLADDHIRDLLRTVLTHVHNCQMAERKEP